MTSELEERERIWRLNCNVTINYFENLLGDIVRGKRGRGSFGLVS